VCVCVGGVCVCVVWVCVCVCSEKTLRKLSRKELTLRHSPEVNRTKGPATFRFVAQHLNHCATEHDRAARSEVHLTFWRRNYFFNFSTSCI